jgi:hypothetical protein
MKKIFLILSALLLIAFPLQAQKIPVSPAISVHTLLFTATSPTSIAYDSSNTFYAAYDMQMLGVNFWSATNSGTTTVTVYRYNHATSAIGATLLTATSASTVVSTDGIPGGSVKLAKGYYYKIKVACVQYATYLRGLLYYTQ